MNTVRQHITHLLEKHAAGTATAAETDELLLALQQNDHDETVVAFLETQLEQSGPGDAADTAFWQERLQGKARAITRPPRRIQRLYWAAAAVTLLAIATGIYNWNSRQVTKEATSSLHIEPGKTGAILTLADGKQVVLDSLGDGTIATQNGASVRLANGGLVYETTGGALADIAYHTTTTPKGRQFQLVLPDGTRVWLNAASSIKYPTRFTGNERKVEVTGEAYFEVAQNVQMPFTVRISDQNRIEVLGTTFNLNAYTDENTINTTLISGSIRVRRGNSSALLTPGQQAQITNAPEIKILHHTDIEKTLAWKKGMFNFQDLTFPEVARQLERWYDIEIVYKGKVPDMQFKGDMDRGVNLSEILRMFDAWNIKARLEGRKLIIE